MTAPTASSPAFCVRLMKIGRYARTLCNLPAGKDGLCKRHRYIEKRKRAAKDARR